MRDFATGPLLSLLLIAAAVVIITWPQARFLTTKVPGHPDTLFGVWRLAWVADSLASPTRRLFDAPIFYPHTNTFAYSDAMLLSGVVTAPLRWAGVNAYVVYNGYLFFALVASGLAAALLCHHLTRNWLASAAAGIVFTASPHRLEHIDRIEMLASFAIPLAFYCWHAGTARASSRWFVAACLCVALQWYCGMYQALFLVCAFACLAADWVVLDRQVKRTALNAIALGTLVSVLLVLPYSIPYFRVGAEFGERGVDEAARYSAELADFAAVHRQNILYGARLTGAPERSLFPGAVAVSLAWIGLLTAPRRVRLLYGLLLVVGFDLCLGTNGVLFPPLRQIALPFREIRAPARAAIVLLLAVAVLASTGMTYLMARIKRPLWAQLAALTLMSLITFEYRVRPNLWDLPAPAPPSFFPQNAVVLDYPVARPDRLDLNVDAHYMVRRMGEWTNMLNGYSGWFPPDYFALLTDAVSFPQTSAIESIARRGATHIALHEFWLPGDNYARLVDALLTRAELAPFGRYDEGVGEVTVFTIALDRLETQAGPAKAQ